MSKTNFSYQAPSTHETLQVTLDGSQLEVSSGSELLLSAAFEKMDSKGQVLVGGEASGGELAILTASEHILGQHEDLAELRLRGTGLSVEHCVSRAFLQTQGDDLKLSRKAFYQNPLLWHRKGRYEVTPEDWTETNGRAHPRRPSVDPGVVYRRTVPRLGKAVGFELLDLDKHLDVFTNWQNQRRVAKFWELNKPKDELRTYLEAVHADPHHAPFVATLDGEPSGYFEIYWAPEDRLGPYYEYSAFDRAFHFLIGNPRHLGRDTFRSFVESITHFLFLEEGRTRQILAEPRADNIALLHYLEHFTYWIKRYEFDFPHKRAALLASTREDFFEKGPFVCR